MEDEQGDEVPPPPELLLAWKVDRWGADAVFDGPIPVKLIMRMTAASNVYDAFLAQAKAPRLANWAKANPRQAQLVASVRTMRQNG